MYLALARKYRPQKFAELIGQNHITRTLQNAITANKLYQAMIFSGMKGVGKTSAARILAKAINCKNGPAAEPCNNCEFCLEITQDNSADYLEIDGASNNGVDEVRSLRDTVRYRPIKNRFRVVVIDEVHMLSTSAWNALLKTIEEPPEHTYFILATTDFHKIPATIVSRCQHFEFRRIPLNVIVQVLSTIASQEKITVSEYGLRLIAQAAEGSLRDAKKILDQAVAISGENVSDQDILDILGVIEEGLMVSLFEAIVGADRQKIVEIVAGLVERGIDARFFFYEFLKFFRDLLILKIYPQQQKLVNISPESIQKILPGLQRFGQFELLRYFNLLRDMETSIKNSEFPAILLELLFLKLTFLGELVALEEFIQKLHSREEILPRKSGATFKLDEVDSEKKTSFSNFESQPESRVEKKIEVDQQSVSFLPEASVGTLCMEEILEKWKEMLQKDYPRFQGIFDLAGFSLRDNRLIIEFDDNGTLLVKNLKEKREELQKMLFSICGQKVEIDIVLKKSEKKKEPEAAEKNAILDDPNLRDLIGRLSARTKIINDEEE